jgi:1-acyl-sn-glycerol-3-phosphate acyltransferase
LPRIARLLLRLGGWTVVGGTPDVHKAVLIAAPHTSNWDGFWALVYKTAIRTNISWFVKDSMFWFPLGTLLRAFGGIPLDRRNAGSAVNEAIAAFDRNERFYFGLAPEGTRSKTRGWKSGFYRIADGAAVPVVCGFLDYRNRVLGLGPVVTLTGDMQADLRIFRAFYASIEGRWPDKASPVEMLR